MNNATYVASQTDHQCHACGVAIPADAWYWKTKTNLSVCIDCVSPMAREQKFEYVLIPRSMDKIRDYQMTGWELIDVIQGYTLQNGSVIPPEIVMERRVR